MTESSNRNKVLRYIAALLSVGVALAISVQIDLLEYRASFAFFFAAVIVSTWYGGRFPGLAAIVLSALAAEYFLIPPVHSLRLNATGAFELAVFLAVAFLINWLTAGFQKREKALRATEEIMRENEARLLTVFGNCPVAVLINRWSDRTFVDVNKEFTRLTGWTRDEVLGRTTAELKLVSEDTAARLRSELEKQDMVADDEMTIRTKDGEIRHVIMDTVIVEMQGERHAVTTFVDISARKKAEEARKISDDRLRIVTENARVGLVMVDNSRHYTFANAAYADILGLPSGDIVGKGVAEVLSPVYEEQIQPRLDRAFSGERVSYQLHQPLNGEDRYYAVRYEPLQGEEPVSQVIVVITDVTEQKLAEIARIASEGRYRTLFEYAPDGILIADKQSYYLDANETMCKMLGYTCDELIGMHASDIIVLDEMQHIEPALEVIKSGSEYSREWMFRRKDGTKFAGEVIATQMPDGNLLGVVRDVTERKQEEAARDSLAAIVESSDDAIISKDLEGRITSWNSAAEKMFGYTREEIFGESILKLIPPDRLDEEPEIIARIMRGEITDHFETVRVGKEGVPIDVSVTVSPIKGPDGRICGASKIIRNITETKRLEDQLRQSQKLDAIGRLAGGIAHDFNNLLTAITGYSALALRKIAADDPLRFNFQEIKNAADRAADLTGQLLAFSRKKILKPTVQNLNSIISDIEKMLARIITENIEFQVVLDPELGNIKADRGQLEQIIVNLVVNARDAMPNGGRLIVETENVYLDQDYVSQHIEIVPGHFIKLTVTDTGSGIDDQTRRHIFDPFFTTKELGQGTGLGLSTVYGIVKQSGGDIMVYSELGHGTTFKIYLPRVDENVIAPKASAGNGKKRGSETILLVEDDEIVRNLTREILHSFGYTVLEAEGGKDALSICENYADTVHLVITDIVMPGMSGLELKDRIRESHPEIRILLMSGYTDESLVLGDVLDFEKIAFIEKPFTPDVLADKIREIFDS